MLRAAERHLSKRNYREAHGACLSVLAQDPRNAQAYFLLGVLTADHTNHAKAVDLFDRALLCDASHAGAHAQKARSLIALNRREAALDAVERAVASSPNDAYTLDTIGVVYSRAGRHEAAVPFYERATRQNENVAAYHYNYASSLQFLGRMDEARAAFRKAIALNPNDARSYSGLVQITKQTAQDNEIAALETLFESAHDADTRLIIGHALAKAFEDLSDSEKAFAWLTRAKADKAKAVGHDPDIDARLFATVRNLPAPHIGKGYADAAPIFIAGMPRTGTTLVDRIMSSHSQVISGGELTDFSLALKRAAQTPGPYVLDPDTVRAGLDADPAALGRAYIKRVEQTLDIKGQRFTDKMPLNVFFAPHILQALPEARMIVLRRHPADTVLSNFRQLFATSFTYYNYAYTLEDTARYTIAFQKLLIHLENTLNPPERSGHSPLFTVVNYEDIVADIEGETQRLLDHCGLPFEEACLNFHQNAAPVATASSAQVRQPLYSSSMGRWKRYTADLKPALDMLIEAGLMSEDELIS